MSYNKVKIVSSFPNQIEAGLIKQICKCRNRNNIYVSIFPRFGYSGAKILLVYFSQKPEGLPFIIKIAKKGDIAREFDAIGKMRYDVRDCKLEEHKIFSLKGWGALLYMHSGTDQPRYAEHPITLREILYCEENKFSSSELKAIINEIYEKLKNAHSKPCVSEVVIRDHFKRYFREHEAKKRISAVLGRFAEEDYFDFISAEIYNPLKFLERLPETSTLNLAKVHGDLHPDNIVLDRTKKPNLIDFAWGDTDRDIFIDYVLLENSIRFMHFPKSANLDEQKLVDELLVNENGWESIQSLTFSNKEAQRLYSRLASMVETIRKRAKATLGNNFSMKNYLFTQFIVLYGLMRFDTYDQYVTTRTLGIIAKRLKEEGW